MKKTILLSLFCLLFSVAMAGNRQNGVWSVSSDDDGVVINDLVSYNINTGEPFVYSYTMKEPGYYFDNISLPFAYDMVVSGPHIEFSVTNEDFRFYFLKERYSKDYFDLHLSTYSDFRLDHEDNHVPNVHPLYKDFVVRIILSR